MMLCHNRQLNSFRKRTSTSPAKGKDIWEQPSEVANFINPTQRKISKWCNEIEQLALFAKTQPQAAYAAFIHGEMHIFTYFLRTIPNMSEFLKPLDDIIDNKLLPAIL